MNPVRRVRALRHRLRPARPGFAPWPRHLVVRVNDLVPADVADADAVRRAVGELGLPIGDRTVPAGPTTRVLLGDTRAGTVVTLERRTARGAGRTRCLRALNRDLRRLVDRTHAPSP